jgi:hypothetical protein
MLDAGGASVPVVFIPASGVIFGQSLNGLTITGSNTGVKIDDPSTGVRVASNLVVKNWA